ncbi:MAG: nucleoside monophosphate kinase [Calothrix sp. MO_192.B10]|nr:nucleoside monophosphate kinase [Calothrix sp. MO_192.B10]
MRLIFLGPPGAGKSTQAAILAKQWQIAHISTSEILPQAIARNTGLGLKIQNYLDAGEVVPDSLLLTAIRERLTKPDAKKGWILDGFPGNSSQFAEFDHLINSLGQPCDGVFLLYVPLNILLERMLKRGLPDDTTEKILNRLAVYQEQASFLIQEYRQRYPLTVVNGDRPIEAITQFIQTSIHSVYPAPKPLLRLKYV